MVGPGHLVYRESQLMLFFLIKSTSNSKSHVFSHDLTFAWNHLLINPISCRMVCSDTTSLGSTRAKCNRNYLFSDGMHTCPETLASRFSAGLACLIGCVYNTATTENKNTTIEQQNQEQHLRLEDGIRECERECNRQFLSVVPIDEAFIDSNTAIASFSD